MREAAEEELAHRPLSQSEVTFLPGYSEESASSPAYRSRTEGHRAQSVALSWRLCEAANEPKTVRAFLQANAPDIEIIETGDSSSTVQLAAKAHGVDLAQIAKTICLRIGNKTL